MYILQQLPGIRSGHDHWIYFIYSYNFFIQNIFLRFLSQRETRRDTRSSRDEPPTCATCEIYTQRLTRGNIYLSRGPSGVAANLIRLKRQIFVSQCIDTPGGGLSVYMLATGCYELQTLTAHLGRCVCVQSNTTVQYQQVFASAPKGIRSQTCGMRGQEAKATATGTGTRTRTVCRRRRQSSAIELQLICHDLICAMPAIVLHFELSFLATNCCTFTDIFVLANAAYLI